MNERWRQGMLCRIFNGWMNVWMKDWMDGWMDGWMDRWMVAQLFLFGPYLENYLIIFLNCFSSLKYMFQQFFWNIRGKKSECSFFQKASPKSGVGFFFDFLNTNSQISRKQLDIFFWLFLVPSEEILRYLLRKNQNKNQFLNFSKNFAQFDFLRFFVIFQF